MPDFFEIVVEINLLAESFKPKSKHYERVKWCLETNFPQALSFLFSHGMF